jgi:uncharacterized protein (TIGR03086 family)
MTETTKTTDTTARQLHTVLSDLATVIDGIGPDRAHNPTPCTDYDVAQLRDHIVGWLTNFADGYDHGRAQADISGYRSTDEPAREVRDAASRIDAALRRGAAEQPMTLGESAMPGDIALGMILLEYQVHGWDLARAVGKPWSPPADAVEDALRFAPAMLTSDYQGEGKPFGPKVPVADNAEPFDRLLGLCGRDPSWTPESAPRRGRRGA